MRPHGRRLSVRMHRMGTVQRVGLATGVELEYEAWGEGTRPLVLVHGFTGSRDDWREVLPALGDLGRTLALDQRGHGGSTNTGDPKSYTLEQLVQDLAAFAEALELGPFDLLGHSLGGMVAQRFALAHPDRVHSLILMDTSPFGVTLAAEGTLRGGAQLGRAAGMGAIAWIMRESEKREPRMAAAGRRFIESYGEEAFWERTTRRMEQMDPEAFLELGRALSVQESVEPQLPEIACPTTVIVGAEDRAFREPSDRIARAISGAVLHVIDAAAHSPQQEAREAWLAIMGDHLERVRKT